ncbi:MAG TPA: hypothetical protein ENK58_06705 [Desulfobacterales bacterium]|nr:MAG: hypothetical protein DRI57_02095 [Deltaproteobacteria bacterium]HHC25087.1 hypothetical protein [Desulfobacterales bacterium]
MKNQKPLAPVLEPETLKKIDLYLEEFYPNAVNAGNEMFSAELGKAQIRGLETLVTSTSRFSEVINYIKNQTGKDKKGKWLQAGPLLLDQLDLLENKADEIGQGDATTVLEIKLRLARGWAKQVTTHYLYSRSQK